MDAPEPDPTPETYDKLTALLIWARDDMRKEAAAAWAEVFDDAALVAARIAGELRLFEDGMGTHHPGKKSIPQVLEELEQLERDGFSREDAWEIVFPRLPRSPDDVGPCLVCCEDFTSGELAVKAPSSDETGYAHLECLHVVMIEEQTSASGHESI